MNNAQKIDHYHRIIPIVDRKDECLFVIPTSILRQAEMQVGDDFIALPRKGGLFIKKIKSDKR